MSDPKLALRDVAVKRGRRTILAVDSLDVLPGEVLAVVGPNGAGKSTLISVLGLLERPSAGEVVFDGRVVKGGRLRYRRRMAVVFQEPLLLDGSVAFNVAAGLRLRGVRRAEREARVRRWLQRFAIEHLARRSVRTLSGGEAQRASLARALALEPEVLLLDEPFAALDEPTRRSLIDDLDSALAETGQTAVFVTHDRSEALRLGDRVAVLIDGRIRQLGTPAEVFSAPADEAVAAFLGVETIVPGVVQSVTHGLAVVRAGSAEVDTTTLLEAGRDVLVCLRPEDVVLSRDEGAVPAATSVRNRLPAAVKRVVAEGPQARVELDAGFPLVALITKQSLEELSLAPGSRVVASFKAMAVHLIPRHHPAP